MNVVVDTNIIFSSLLSTESSLRTMLFKSKNYTFYAPNYTYLELFKHKDKIIKYSKLPEVEVFNYLENILDRINFVNKEVVSSNSYSKAYEYCKDTDLNDIPFVALAIEFDALFWTGDKKIINGLKERGFTAFFSLTT